MVGAFGLLALLVITCVIPTFARRRSLQRASAACAALPAGIMLGEARTRLGELGATELGRASPPIRIDLGVRGDLTSWQCDLVLDAAGTTVVRTEFRWWIPPDPHGEWDDATLDWIERHFL